MNAIERAAEVMVVEGGMGPSYRPVARDIAELLADAGLLLTDAARAILDAAEHWHHVRSELDWEAEGWIDAVAEADAALDESVAAWREATS